MSSNHIIEEPSKGSVTLELSWDDAVVLTRIVGLTNSGDLTAAAPDLHEFVTEMTEIIGRPSPSDMPRFHVSGAQIRIEGAWV